MVAVFSVISEVLVRLHGDADARRLLAAVTLDGLDALQPDAVIKAIDDSSRDVRMSAIRISERWLGEPNSPVQAAVLKHLEAADWSVRLQLTTSLGVLPPGPRERAARP